MRPIKSPDGAWAAVGASDIAQLGGKVDRENSLRTLTAQPPPPRAGDATKLAGCDPAINPWRASRRQKYCSYHCHDEARRARNFAASGATRRGSSAIPRPIQDNGLRLIACKPNSAIDRLLRTGIAGRAKVMTAGSTTFTPTGAPRDRIAARVRARVFTGGRKRTKNEKDRRELG
jgi:hypothetical protein